MRGRGRRDYSSAGANRSRADEADPSLNMPNIARPDARGVQALLMDEQVDLGIAQLLHRANQVRQRSPEPIEGPDHRHVEAATNRILQHQVELWPPLASLRAQLRRVIETLGPCDVLMVTRLDRLARSTRDLLNTLAAIADRKAGFRSLGDAWADTTTSHGRLMLTVLGGLAEFERDLIRKRTAEGREYAAAIAAPPPVPAACPLGVLRFCPATRYRAGRRHRHQSTRRD